MKLLNAKLLLTVFGLVIAVLTSPALAQTQHHHRSQQRYMTTDPDPQIGQGIYDVVPGYGTYSNQFDPAEVGGGSFGYNQSLQDNKGN
jgi:hypothetical protein